MNLVRKTFMLFLGAFLLQMALLSIMLLLGYTHSEGTWKQLRLHTIERAAADIIAGDPSRQLPQDIPAAVYDADRNLLEANRGVGRGSSLHHAELIPVTRGDEITGYYAAGQLSFRYDAANRQLLDTMTRVFFFGLIFALLISLAAARYFSNHIAKPAQRIAQSLEGFTRNSRSAELPAEGAEEILHIAAALAGLQQRLQDEQKLRSQWAQDIAHDLRTPVASVKAQLEAMKDGILPATQSRFTLIAGELSRLEQLVCQLEELMQLESPEMVISPRTIDAAGFLAQAARQHDPNPRKVTVRTETAVPVLTADEALLYRGVSNLLTNAVRHTPEGETVTLRIFPEDQGTALQVSNPGDPIPPEELPNIFNRLFRGEYARSSHGSGLGLTIVKQIALLHGGSVRCSSSAEAETVFTLYLPQ